MSDEEGDALRRWAERQSGTALAAQVNVENVESKTTGLTVVSGCVTWPLTVCGRSAKCSLQLAIPDGPWKGDGTVIPGATIWVVGKLAAKEPLKPVKGSVPVGTGKVGVTGWSPSHAFFEMRLEDCQAPVLVKAATPQVPPPANPPPEKGAVPVKPPVATPPVATPPVAVPPVAPAAKAGPVVFMGTTIDDVGKVVYILDRSGSMSDAFDRLQAAVERSIGALTPPQQFHVIFYSSGPPVELPQKILVAATDAAKDEAAKFIATVVPQGETDPAEALTRAFALKPDAICLMTDGEFDHQIVDLIKKLNADGKTRIYTFAFLYQLGESTLKQIAEGNGGKYRYISDRDLPPLGKE
jgi:hypothetical protein